LQACLMTDHIRQAPEQLSFTRSWAMTECNITVPNWPL
jgi:hypothetical protein